MRKRNGLRREAGSDIILAVDRGDGVSIGSVDEEVWVRTFEVRK